MSTKEFYFFLIASNLIVLFLYGSIWYQKVQDLITWMPIDEWQAWIKTFPTAIVPFLMTLVYLVYYQIASHQHPGVSDMIIDNPEFVNNIDSAPNNS